MKPGYVIEEYGVYSSLVVWVYNWKNSNKVGLAHYDHNDYDPGNDKNCVAKFKIKQ